VAEAAFDAAISRVGLIYFPDRQAALGGIRRALRPGGRLSAIVYSTAKRNAFFAVPVGIIRAAHTTGVRWRGVGRRVGIGTGPYL
jgi:ubiquinone/menaquinone biosynthesis C-methylase UbiE